MNKNLSRGSALAFIVSALITSGCSTTGTGTAATDDSSRYQSMLKDKESEIATLKSTLSTKERELASARSMAGAPAAMPATTGGELLPPNAKPGECYARAYIAPTYRTETDKLLVSPASERIDTVPAKFAWGTEKVLVKEASERIEVIPATYKWVTENVLVKPASERLESVPAQYKTVTENVLVKPESTTWKKGTGPITKIDESTGEIMCLVTVPASYKTVSKRELVTPATTRAVAIPAEYKTVKKQVMATPPTTRTVVIPAEYKTVKVKKLVEPAKSMSTPITERYETITKRIQATEGRLEWRPVLCRTNLTPEIGMRIQNALKKAGHNPGLIDGIIGAETMGAVRAYQTEKGLPRGALTLRTLDSLGVKL